VTRSPAAPPRPSIVGVEAATLNDANAQLLQNAGAAWVRRNALTWGAVEPEEGARNWGAVAALEQDLLTASKRGLKPILIIRDTPAWAQQAPGFSCGPVRPDKLAALGTFVRDAVARYSARPFNVQHYEFWNEPDVPTGLIPPNEPFGCWANASDPLAGGGAFAEALKAIYPQLKAANPQAQLLVGGLLLDCDPIHPPQNKNCRESHFLEGILSAGGGASFDAVSFHAYDNLGPTRGSYGNSNWNSSSAVTGPVLIAKARFLRNVLDGAGARNKPLLNTESGLLCWGKSGTPDCEMSKAFYMPQAFAVAQAEGLAANVWYSLEGWNGTSLIDGAGKKTPAYTALKVAGANLGRANFVRVNTDYPGVLVYEFTNAGKRLWVVWSLDGQPKPLTLPRAPTRATDSLGNRVTASTQMTASTNPLYLEFPLTPK
jgi:hypothetical protein